MVGIPPNMGLSLHYIWNYHRFLEVKTYIGLLLLVAQIWEDRKWGVEIENCQQTSKWSQASYYKNQVTGGEKTVINPRKKQKIIQEKINIHSLVYTMIYETLSVQILNVI